MIFNKNYGISGVFYFKAYLIALVLKCTLSYTLCQSQEKEFLIEERKIPPKPDNKITITAKPNPYETQDPTTQAKVTLLRNLFSDENGEIIYYALLVAKEGVKPPCQENGLWKNESWPDIPTHENENVSFYQVTPERWFPFSANSNVATFVLGDGVRFQKYWNKPLKEKSKYALIIRGFTVSGFQDTNKIDFETLEHLPLTLILSYLGGIFIVTAIAVCLSIFDFKLLKRIRFRAAFGKAKDSFSPVPVAISQKAFLKYAQELLNTPGRLGNEFHLLGTLSSDVSTLCLHAQRLDNRKKNRYGNILPFDVTRVKLSVIDDDPSTDYINASFIKGYTQEIEYIACQGPQEETCHDFYRMIIEQNIETIVMLTELKEKGFEKCYKYYPELGMEVKIKEITVICVEMDELEFWIKRVLTIHRSGKVITVTHFHFKNWYDFLCPEDADSMIKFCECVHRSSRKSCIVVHCSAGAGRTGTFIAIDILLQDVKNNHKICVFNTVLILRQQRISMVQTEVQLGYIYKCVSRAIENSQQKNKDIF